MELEVQKDAGTPGDELPDEGGALEREQPRADLESASEAVERGREFECALARVDVQRD